MKALKLKNTSLKNNIVVFKTIFVYLTEVQDLAIKEKHLLEFEFGQLQKSYVN